MHQSKPTSMVFFRMNQTESKETEIEKLCYTIVPIHISKTGK